MTKEQIEAFLEDNPFEQLSNVVFNIIEKEITSLRLRAGTKLNISKISEELNISRTPVREALIKLHELGYVCKPPDKSGYYVSEFNTNDISKIYFMRSMIEGRAAYLCARRSVCPNINKMKKLANSFNETSNEYEKFSENDYKFHKLIVLSSGNEYFVKFYNLLESKFIRMQKSNLGPIIKNKHDVMIQQIIAEHNAVINSIDLNMPEMAEKEMTSHINSSLNATLLFSKASFDL